MKFSYTVSAAEAGQSLIHFCKRQLDLPHAGLQKAFRTKAIRLNGAKDDGKTIVVEGDIVTALFPFRTPDTSGRQDTVYRMQDAVYQDDQLLVLNKPSGIAVHGGSKQETTMDTLVRRVFGSMPFIPQPAHRIDKDTSGILIFGKTVMALQRLGEAFQKHTVRKTYHALVHGHLEKTTGVITAPLLTNDNASVKTKVDPAGKPAETRYEVVEEYETHSLVRLQPLTGRTHQLRVHMAHLGHPILGDTRYGDADLDNAVFGKRLPKRLYLHCSEMVLPAEAGFAQLSFSAPHEFFKK